MAIEVELTPKTQERVRDILGWLFDDYHRVVYYATPRAAAVVRKAGRSRLDSGTLTIRPYPLAEEEAPSGAPPHTAEPPTAQPDTDKPDMDQPDTTPPPLPPAFRPPPPFLSPARRQPARRTLCSTLGDGGLPASVGPRAAPWVQRRRAFRRGWACGSWQVSVER